MNRERDFGIFRSPVELCRASQNLLPVSGANQGSFDVHISDGDDPSKGRGLEALENIIPDGEADIGVDGLS